MEDLEEEIAEVVEAMHLAVREGDLALAAEIIDRGFVVDELLDPHDLMTPLHTACGGAGAAAAEMVQLLLDNGSQLEVRDSHGRTPLLIALDLAQIDPEVVSMLLTSGASVDAVDSESVNALHFAVSSDDFDIVSLLLEKGASPELSDDLGCTPLMYASSIGAPKTASLLIGKGANIHAVDKSGNSALHWASSSASLECCKLLCNHGCDPGAANKQGKTPLEIYGTSVLTTQPWSTQEGGAPSPSSHPLTREEQLIGAAEMTSAQVAYLRHANAKLALKVAELEGPSALNAKLLFSEAFSDLVFEAGGGGERIHAHKALMAASSPTIATLLQGPWAENFEGMVSTIRVEQSPAALRCLLRYVYTGVVETDACTSHTMDVLDLAAQHDLPALKVACETHAIKALEVSNVVSVLIASHVHELDALKAACISLIKGKSLALLMSPTWPGLRSDHPALWEELKVVFDSDF